MTRRILVTGGTGVLGHGFRAIRAQFPGDEFVLWGSRDCDLSSSDDVLREVAAVRPDALVHCAALSGGIGLTRRHPATILRTNLLMDVNVLEAARRLGVKKTVLSLSVGMYPANAPLPLKEESMHEGMPHEAAASYAFGKRLVDPLIRAYRAEYGISAIGLVPNGIFGEHDHFHAEQGTMLASLIRRFHEQRDGKGPIVVWGDGTPLREYTHAPDLARAYMWALDNYDQPQVLNVGSTEERSVREIAMMIADLMGIDRTRIVFDTTKPAGAARRNTDNSRFLTLSGFSYTPFAEALASTIRWYTETMRTSPESVRFGSKIAGC